MNSSLKLSALVATAALAFTSCSEDLTAVTSSWNSLQGTMTSKMAQLSKAGSELKAQAADVAVDAKDNEGAAIKRKLDAAVASFEGGIGGLKGIIDGVQPKITEAIKVGKIEGVQSAMASGKAEFDEAVTKLDTKPIEALLSELRGHVTEFIAKKTVAEVNPTVAVAPDAAPIVDSKKIGDADYFYADFEPGTDKLKVDNVSTRANLDSMVSLLKSCKEIAVEVEGHTSKVGVEKANKLLSAKRAQAVTRYLVDTNKISPSKIKKTIGMGSDVPAMEEPLPGSAEEKAMDPAKLALARERNERIRLKILSPCK